MTSAGLNNLVPLAAPQAPKSVYRPEDARSVPLPASPQEDLVHDFCWAQQSGTP